MSNDLYPTRFNGTYVEPTQTSDRYGHDWQHLMIAPQPQLRSGNGGSKPPAGKRTAAADEPNRRPWPVTVDSETHAGVGVSLMTVVLAIVFGVLASVGLAFAGF